MMELSQNYWGGQSGPDAEVVKPELEPVEAVSEQPEKITEADRIRARVAVLRGESDLYFIRVPSCDFSKLETRPAGGGVFEVVYNETVFGYTKSNGPFGINEAKIEYQ